MWEKSHDEQVFYSRMFQLADVDKTGKIEGKAAVEFFTKSGLPAVVLKQVWSLASSNMQPYLNQEEFNVALGLIALAQRGESLDLAKMAALGQSHSLPLPVLNVNGTRDFVMATSDEEKYKTLFRDAVGDINGALSGAAAMDLFQKSGLNLPELQEIYRLVGTSSNDSLHIHGFTIAMHLIVCKTRRGMGVLPATVPMELFPTLVLPQITLESISSGTTASDMLHKQLVVQKQLQDAYGRVPSHVASLEAQLSAVESLGYPIPPSARRADGSSLNELEGILQRYIAQAQQEVQALEQDQPASSPVSVQTLLQTLTNLKQQSTRLVEQKEALLRSRHQSTSHLHIDVGSKLGGGGLNTSFEASSSFDATPAHAAAFGWDQDTPPDFSAPPVASAAPAFVSEPNLSLFSPVHESAPSFFDATGGTGGSTSVDLLPQKTEVSKAALVMDAFTSASGSTFNALEAMNVMDLGVTDKYDVTPAKESNDEFCKPKAPKPETPRSSTPSLLKKAFSSFGDVPVPPAATAGFGFGDTTASTAADNFGDFGNEKATDEFSAPATNEHDQGKASSGFGGFKSSFGDFDAKPEEGFGAFGVESTAEAGFGDFKSDFGAADHSTEVPLGAFESNFGEAKTTTNDGFGTFGDFASSTESNKGFGGFDGFNSAATSGDKGFGDFSASEFDDSSFGAPTSSSDGFGDFKFEADSSSTFSAEGFGGASTPSQSFGDFDSAASSFGTGKTSGFGCASNIGAFGETESTTEIVAKTSDIRVASGRFNGFESNGNASTEDAQNGFGDFTTKPDNSGAASDGCGSFEVVSSMETKSGFGDFGSSEFSTSSDGFGGFEAATTAPDLTSCAMDEFAAAMDRHTSKTESDVFGGANTANGHSSVCFGDVINSPDANDDAFPAPGNAAVSLEVAEAGCGCICGLPADDSSFDDFEMVSKESIASTTPSDTVSAIEGFAASPATAAPSEDPISISDTTTDIPQSEMTSMSTTNAPSGFENTLSGDVDFGQFDAFPSTAPVPPTTAPSFPSFGAPVPSSESSLGQFDEFQSTAVPLAAPSSGIPPLVSSNAFPSDEFGFGQFDAFSASNCTVPPAKATDDIFGDFQFSADTRRASESVLGTKHLDFNFTSVPASGDAAQDTFADFADFKSSIGTSAWEFPAPVLAKATADDDTQKTPASDFTF
ncbi:Aste57867_15766 [Aphanomyces stellatus]|uniref:Aste57867_15766 protein n=1 Tax=Aphanomyces stellatus TaxID=120398 RepID=A0A485L4F8_9STRA|nr:hypothetical protein As57867_015710 [Aphanomyces stellatus]VFT92554.1 Aste57867_15766 [Aphanomyces stellatus]